MIVERVAIGALRAGDRIGGLVRVRGGEVLDPVVVEAVETTDRWTTVRTNVPRLILGAPRTTTILVTREANREEAS